MISKFVKVTSALLVGLIFLVGCSQGENSEKYNKKTVENVCNESPGLTEEVFKDEYLKKEGKDRSNIEILNIDLQGAYYYYSDEDGLNCGEK